MNIFIPRVPTTVTPCKLVNHVSGNYVTFRTQWSPIVHVIALFSYIIIIVYPYPGQLVSYLIWLSDLSWWFWYLELIISRLIFISLKHQAFTIDTVNIWTASRLEHCTQIRCHIKWLEGNHLLCLVVLRNEDNWHNVTVNWCSWLWIWISKYLAHCLLQLTDLICALFTSFTTNWKIYRKGTISAAIIIESKHKFSSTFFPRVPRNNGSNMPNFHSFQVSNKISFVWGI